MSRGSAGCREAWSPKGPLSECRPKQWIDRAVARDGVEGADRAPRVLGASSPAAVICQSAR
jgi:hypothetical protein